jgi:hypothetical protein
MHIVASSEAYRTEKASSRLMIQIQTLGPNPLKVGYQPTFFVVCSFVVMTTESGSHDYVAVPATF